MLKADDSGVVFQCADCGRKLTYAQTQFRYLPSGCGREPVCRDDRLCELTMDTVVMKMGVERNVNQFKPNGRVHCHH